MQLKDLAITVLLSISHLLGVSDVPGQKVMQWQVVKPWHMENGAYVFEASSSDMVSLCQQHPNENIQFPMIIHGAHEIFRDNIKVLSFGDPSFKTVRSFFGAPAVACSEFVGGKTIHWKAYCYSKYFSRFSSFPELSQTHSNLFAETLSIIAAGGLLLMGIFTFVIFWGKIPHALTFSVSLSNVFLSLYFMGSVAGFVGLDRSMLFVHKFADTGVWIGLALFFNALRLHGVFGTKLYMAYLLNILIGIPFILAGASGDSVQFGTTLPFGLTMGICFYGIVKLARNAVVVKKWERRALFEFLSLTVFLIAILNDILVITGATRGYLFLSMGFMGGLLFFALSVNERITQMYRERDYLRGNLEVEVEKKTLELKNKTVALETTMSDLKATQADLVQSAKLVSLGTLSAGIAHEINNSLNYVYGSLHPLEKTVSTLTEADKQQKMQKLIAIMRDGLKLTFDIIKSLRSFTGLNQAAFNEVRIKEVVDSVLTILRGKIGDKVKVLCDVPTDLRVFGSVVGLNQVLMNLISNAVDAMSAGGDLRISASKASSDVRITISDTGSGISSEIRDRIFEPFFTTKAVGQGSGLGLYIVKMELQRHKGVITVDSQVGKGTTFTVQLPANGSTMTQVAA